ncbi:transcription termination/antitermination factor NusG [Oribacterium asaccharolyticum ACB7]|jgi:transcription termination/antitermination factor nusG|uniref:Transcription termination/antitermination protein NusG n=1 Tax=Oribacterium asaccharolyticum ACB7 TaxID=796944 RepID=G9WRX4_9FIRM|nr:MULTISPECIES: transcription termination/antitermination protein NusG [Oribacterium]EGL36196.1 transcription termination/antitermination factor NusG [Oribacterium sp. oral taxon 108 str. F0425]EHL14064.1 transcription termination/antitermination factor NusG [Oribacterium asaccharolyticum ACB7]
MAEKNTEARWYVAHTYSGYENKVKMDLEKTIDNRGLQDVILEVSVPMQPVIEVKNGVEKKTDKKMFPGYVLVNMVMNDETWYVVRNTRGVTGFVGPGSKPVPLSEEEILTLGYRKSEVLVDFAVGDTVTVISGTWRDTIGVITQINDQKKTVTINVEMFGRDTPVELSYGEVQKLR